MEIAKRQNHAQTLTTVLRNTPHGLCMLSSTFVVTWANRALHHLLDPKANSTRDLADLEFKQIFQSDKEFDEYAESALKQIRMSGCDTRELLIRRMDGSSIWCEISLVRHNPAQTSAGFVATLADLSDRKRADQALQQSERRFRMLIENAIDIILVVSREGRIVFASPSICRTLGCAPEHAAGRQIRDLIHVDDVASLRAKMDEGKAEEHGSQTIERVRMMHADGTWRMFEVSIVNRLSDSEIEGYILNCHDITAQFHAEERLWEQKAFLHRVIDTDPNLIFVKDEEGRFTLVNKSMADFHGVPIQRLAGMSERELYIDKAAAAQYLEEDSEVIRTGKEKIIAESRARDHQGHFHWMETIKRPILSADGKNKNVLVIVSDVTKRKSAEEENQRLASFPRENPHPVFSADLQGNILYMNPAAIRRLKKLKLSSPLQFLPPDHLQQIENCIKHGKSETGIEIKIGDSVYLWTYHPVLELKTIHLYGTDITQLRKAQETLREREEQLLQSQKMDAIGRLAGGVAHDFNNLLTVIQGYAEILLARKMQKTDPLRKDILQIRKAAQKAAGLTSQLLAFSRRQTIMPEIVDLHDIMQDLEKLLQPLIGEQTNLVMQSDPGVGIVMVDPGQLEQVLMNLVVNARDAMPRGGNIFVKVDQERLKNEAFSVRSGLPSGEYVTIRVIDTGAGMPPEIMSKIFEPFFTTKEVGKGTGLGLATVYGIVKQSGGHISVESEEGKGSTFTIWLPLFKGGEGEKKESSSPVSSATLRGRETILLVEDEDMVREMTREILVNAGYMVLEARNAMEALRISDAETSAVQLLVSDVIMPQLSGPELARRLLTKRPGMQVLLISGYPNEEFDGKGIDLQTMRLLQKPFNPKELTRNVREILDQVRPQV